MRSLSSLTTLLVGLFASVALIVSVIGPLHAGHIGGGEGHGGGGGGDDTATRTVFLTQFEVNGDLANGLGCDGNDENCRWMIESAYTNRHAPLTNRYAPVKGALLKLHKMGDFQVNPYMDAHRKANIATKSRFLRELDSRQSQLGKLAGHLFLCGWFEHSNEIVQTMERSVHFQYSYFSVLLESDQYMEHIDCWPRNFDDQLERYEFKTSKDKDWWRTYIKETYSTGY